MKALPRNGDFSGRSSRYCPPDTFMIFSFKADIEGKRSKRKQQSKNVSDAASREGSLSLHSSIGSIGEFVVLPWSYQRVLLSSHRIVFILSSCEILSTVAHPGARKGYCSRVRVRIRP